MEMTLEQLLKKLEDCELIIMDDWVMETVTENPYTWKNIRGSKGINKKLAAIGLTLNSKVIID